MKKSTYRSCTLSSLREMMPIELVLRNPFCFEKTQEALKNAHFYAFQKLMIDYLKLLLPRK